MTHLPRCVVIATMALFTQSCATGQSLSVPDEIRAEATRANSAKEGHPLPLLSHWTTGAHEFSKGWRPVHQLELIEQGRFLLPWFDHPDLNLPVQPQDNRLRFFEYYEGPLKKCRELRLPIVFVATQWEHLLSGPPYVDLPADQNPNVVTTNGVVLKEVSPFGPVELWREVGRKWTDNARLKQLQEWYPDPPLVIFLSNNEHPRLQWLEAEKDKRYLDKYGKGRDDNFKRKVVAQGWIERYRALQDGMRRGLVNPAWRKNSSYVGYGAFGLEHLGRWGGWKNYSLYVPGRIDANPLMWDGGSPSFYTHNWNPSTDYTTWSPQIEFMNDVFQQKEAYRLNPRFWLELSIWDGYTGSETKDDKRKYYANLGQEFTPQRYAAMVQFGMWLLRPRAVREFRGWLQPWAEDAAPYFLALADAVDRVHNNPVLREWWRKGELVPNRAHQHPYQVDIPKEYRQADRWFLLDADCNMQEYPWELFWKIPVFSLALTRGQAPHREWLVYAHAPLGERKGVKLTIPGYQTITVDVSVGGAFYEVVEKNHSIKLVADETGQK